MQTTYTNGPDAALAGMLADGDSCEIVSYPASEVIAPGLLVVVKSDGTCELPKTAGAMPTSGAGAPLGVAIYTSAAPSPVPVAPANGGYQVGDMVPILRRGKIWAQLKSGDTPSDLTALNVENSSTVAANRGVFTTGSTSTTAGSEVSEVPRCVARETFGSTLVKVELNLP